MTRTTTTTTTTTAAAAVAAEVVEVTPTRTDNNNQIIINNNNGNSYIKYKELEDRYLEIRKNTHAHRIFSGRTLRSFLLFIDFYKQN